MLKTFSDQEIEEQYQKLPDALKLAMVSSDIANTIVAIGKKFGLTIEKIGFLSDETAYVVLGLMRPNEFVAALAESLEIPADKAKEVALAVNSQIFSRLREDLKKTHQIEVSMEEIERGALAIPKIVEPPPAGPKQPPSAKTIFPQPPKPEAPMKPPVLTESPKPTPTIPSAIPPVFSALSEKAPVSKKPPIPQPSIHSEIRPLAPKPPSIRLDQLKKVDIPDTSQKQTHLTPPSAPKEMLGVPPSDEKPSIKTPLPDTTPASEKEKTVPSEPKSQPTQSSSSPLPRTFEKKMSYDGTDPYREPVE